MITFSKPSNWTPLEKEAVAYALYREANLRDSLDAAKKVMARLPKRVVDSITARVSRRRAR